MTTPKDRLKPSPELVAQWSIESGEHEKALEYVCTKAAEWGAQQRGVVVPIEVAEVVRDAMHGQSPLSWTKEEEKAEEILIAAIADAKEKGE